MNTAVELPDRIGAVALDPGLVHAHASWMIPIIRGHGWFAMQEHLEDAHLRRNSHWYVCRLATPVVCSCEIGPISIHLAQAEAATKRMGCRHLAVAAAAAGLLGVDCRVDSEAFSPDKPTRAYHLDKQIAHQDEAWFSFLIAALSDTPTLSRDTLQALRAEDRPAGASVLALRPDILQGNPEAFRYVIAHASYWVLNGLLRDSTLSGEIRRFVVSACLRRIHQAAPLDNWRAFLARGVRPSDIEHDLVRDLLLGDAAQRRTGQLLLSWIARPQT